MHIGGIQRSLINLLNEISVKHDVSLFLFYPEGELLKRVPENVKIIGGNGFTRIMGMSHAEAKQSGIVTFLRRSFWTVATRVFGIGVVFGILSGMQKLKGEYDAAISFMQNSDFKYFYGGCNEFAIKSVKAEKKITFIHCDFRNFFGNNPYNRAFYKHFDRIACVSDSCKKVFDEVCPEYADKTVSVHNCVNFREMEKLKGEYEAKYTKGATNLFTAARISEEKGIFRMFPIFAYLKSKGFSFVWRVAGDGPLFEKALEERKKYGLDENVEFLGMLSNPYPYFDSSDMLIVPSYNEAAPMVYDEAAYFGLPVFTTETTSAREMVESRGAGFVCENTDEGIRKKLEELLAAPDIILDKAKRIAVSNEKALEEFENLIK